MTTEALDPRQAADQAARVVAEISVEPDAPLTVETDPDRTRDLKFGLSRMRTDWTPEDAPLVQGVLAVAEGAIRRLFPDAFLLMNELWALVREPEHDPETGAVRVDVYGWPTGRRPPPAPTSRTTADSPTASARTS